MSVTEIANRQIQSVIAGHVAGVNWGQEFVGEQVLLPVDTFGEEFIYETRGNEALVDPGNIERAIDGDTAQFDSPANGTVKGTLKEYAAGGTIDYRLIHADEVADGNAAARGATGGMSRADSRRLGRATNLERKIMIKKEKAIFAIVFGTGSYDSTLWYGTGGGQAVVDFKAAGIIKKIAEAKDAVAQAYGFEPDTLTLGRQKYLDLWANAEILARITGGANNQNPAVVNDQLLAGMFGVSKLVRPKAFTQTLAAPGAVGTTTNIANPDYASLTYSGQGLPQDLQSPAFGKLFHMNVPETNVRVDVRTWMSGNGKKEHIEVTEFFLAAQCMKAGALFTT